MGKNAINDYLKRIGQAYSRKDATENTYRTALEILLEALGGKGVTATNEPKRIKCGAPDYIITRGEAPLGYIEAKDIGKNLDKIETSEQMLRYREGLPNLILTDYLEFRWYVKGEHRMTERLAKTDAKNKIKPVKDGHEKVAELLKSFFEAEPPPIETPKELADRMARLARIMRDAIAETIKKEEEKGSLHHQMEGFKKVLLHDLKEDEFADMYAQTICYGLFSARCNHHSKERFTRKNAPYDLPNTNPFLKKMFFHIAGEELDKSVLWAVDDLAELLHNAQIKSILRDFGKRTRREDPVVHFYETFLAQYDPKMREARGVYYTPEPVVSYIVKSVDHILKTDFALAEGLGDSSMIDYKHPETGKKETAHKVQILDPAAGTGTFLYEVIEQIHESFKGNRGMWAGYVSKHLLPRLYGFELLMAPYTVAHMKLGLQLSESGFEFKEKKKGGDKEENRLRIYLTNTLEEAQGAVQTDFAQWIAEEANHAKDVKRNAPVMIVLGNPPYSYESKNTGEWITKLLKGEDILFKKETGNYFEVDGQPLGERNPKGLQDDYVKFIRFAQWRIERTGYGILGFICNHGYLDNPTFRGMRQTLMETFDDIYILDLHGNTKKKEKCPDGSPDKNVFDIQQGVAIGIFVKRNGGKKAANIKHADLWGQREIFKKGEFGNDVLKGGKYRWLWDNEIKTTKWKKLKPRKPFYLFVPQDTKLLGEYEKGWKVTDILPVNSVGVFTARDKLVIGWSRDEIYKRAKDFASLPVEDARQKYDLGKDGREWKVHLAQKDLKDSGISKDKLTPILYRPFDTRFTHYTGQSRGFICRPRPKVMGHMIAGENLGLISARSNKSQNPDHFFCTKFLMETKCGERTTTSALFPLYLYPDTGKQKDFFDNAKQTNAQGGRRPNLSEGFIKDFSQKLKLTFVPDGRGDLKKTFGPEDIFDYMYAVFHSPEYRKRYSEFLKIDFPRLPLTSNKKLFRKLCGLGGKLVKLHLMDVKAKTKVKDLAKYPVQGDDVVDKVRYSEPGQGAKEGRVWINKTQFFAGVSPEVWEFHIGGYQVCQKWLKDRKGRELDYDERLHYQNIVSALAETMRLMENIDEAIYSNGGFPGAF